MTIFWIFIQIGFTPSDGIQLAEFNRISILFYFLVIQLV